VVVGPRPEDLATVAYEGKFWIDAQSAELSKMTIEVSKPPPESTTCRIETAIDYRQARIRSADFLLPRLTVIKLWDVEGERWENRIEYDSCREFQSESVFRADPRAAGRFFRSSDNARDHPAGDHGQDRIALQIDSESSF
jgi:hypothetical protein